jgi:hypothetical protein
MSFEKISKLLKGDSPGRGMAPLISEALVGDE